MSKKWNYKLLSLSVYIAIFLLLERYLSDYLYSLSFDLIKKIQTAVEYSYFLKIIAELGSDNSKYYILCFTISFFNYYHAFIYTMSVYLALFFSQIMKIIYQEPRPFWEDIGIIAHQCKFSYGYPSNNVQSTIPAYLTLLTLFYFRHKLHLSSKSRIIFTSGVILIYCFFIIEAFSRMAMGVNSIDQVLFGLFFGLSIYYLIFDILCYNPKDYYCLINLLKNRTLLHRFLCIYLIGYLYFLTLFLFKEDNTKPEWIKNINAQCRYQPIYTPYYKCLLDSTEYFGLLGCISGILYELEYNFSFINSNGFKQVDFEVFTINCISFNKISQKGLWNNIPFWKKLIIFLISCIWFLINSQVFPYFVKNIDNIIIIYFLDNFIPNFLFTFGLFGFLRKLSIKLKLGRSLENEI